MNLHRKRVHDASLLVAGAAASLAALGSGSIQAAQRAPRVPFSKLRILETPSLAARWQATRHLPATSAEVQVECYIDADGRPSSCKARGLDGSPATRAAERLARDIRLDARASGIGPAGAMATLPVEMSPPAGLALQSPPGQLTPFNQVNWAQTPSSTDMGRNYPDAAGRVAASAAVAATCKVLSDLSLACVSFDTQTVSTPAHAQITPGQFDDDFEKAAEQISLKFKSKAQMKDGRPAAGQWVRAVFRFTPG